MDTTLFRFTELAASLKDRGNIVSIGNIEELRKDWTGETFINTLLFDSNFLAYVANSKTVSGYKGIGYMPYFPIDFDGTIASSQEQVINFTEYLAIEGVPVDNFLYYFSGNKGFHVLIPNSMIQSFPSESISQTMKNFADLLLDNIIFDPSIYNHIRLFRLKNSLNAKSGLYKIALTYKEILTLTPDDITKLATEKRYIDVPRYSGNAVQFLQSIWQQALTMSTPLHVLSKIDENTEFKQACYRNIFDIGVKEGNRNNVALRAAWILKKHSGMPLDMAMIALDRWNTTRNKPPLTLNELTSIVQQAYKGSYHFGCSDSVLSEYCSDSCPIKKKYDQNSDIKETSFPSISTIGYSYLEFIETYHKNKLGFGHANLDKYLRGLLPSTIAYILARSGVGKTSFIIDSISRIIDVWNVPVMLFSLEMSREMIFERLLSRYLKKNFSDIPDITQNKGYYSDCITKMQKSFQKLILCDKPALYIKEMEEYVKLVESSIIGEKIRVIFIDYLGLIRSNKPSEYERVSDVVYDIQAWAKRSHTTIVTLTQTGREKGGAGSVELDLDSGRGSGVIEETADFMLGLWRTTNNNSEQIQLKILKNRFGKSGISFSCNVEFEKQYWDIKENVTIRGE